jgi:hypothetical protein
MPRPVTLICLQLLLLLMTAHPAASATVAEQYQIWTGIVSEKPELQKKILKNYNQKTHAICTNVGLAFLASESKGSTFGEENQLFAGFTVAATNYFLENSKIPKSALTAEMQKYTEKVKQDMNAFVQSNMPICVKISHKILLQ